MTTRRSLNALARLTALPEDEASWETWVADEARRHGWAAVHFRPARTAAGWRTPVAYDGAGFVDLILVKDRVIFAELKSQTGRLEPPQRAWRDRLAGAGAEWYCWRPADRPHITAILERNP